MHQLTGTPEGLFTRLLARRPDAPLVTWYDETPGRPARIELSARSMSTWAAKTAGLLGDELGLGPGDRVLVDLPAHWLTVGVLAGCWAAGVEVVTPGAAGAAGLAAALVALDRHTHDVDELFTVDPSSPLQLGGPDGALPGARDLPSALRPHADRLGAMPGGGDDPALDGRSRSELAAAAPLRAEELAVTADAGRLLWSGPLDPDGIVSAVLAPWSVTGSLVLVHRTDPGAGAGPGTDPAWADRLAALAATEGVDVVR